MRQLGITATCVAIAIAMTGCASSQGTISESEFLAHSKDLSEFSGVGDGFDSRIIDAGKGVCRALKADTPDPWASTVAGLTKAGMDANEAGQFIVYSTAAFCPDQADKLPDA